MPIHSIFPSIPVPTNVDVWSLLQVHMARYMNRDVMVDSATGERITYQQFHDQVMLVRNSLWHHGIRKGDVVLNFSPNNTLSPVLLFAVMSIGSVYSTCNPAYTKRELGSQMIDSNVTCVATTPELLPVLEGASSGIKLKLTVVYGDSQPNCISFKDLLSPSCPSAPHVEINPKKDIAWILYSSGTTGKPKGVLLSHYNVVANNLQTASHNTGMLTFDGEGSMVYYLPAFHIFGMFLMLHALTNGKTLIIMGKFHFEDFLKLLVNYKTSVIALVPPVATLLAKSPLLEKYDLSFVQCGYCGAAPVALSVINQLKARLPKYEFRQSFGMTEIGCGMSSLPGGGDPTSVGHIMPNMECKIVDFSTGKELGVHQEGEILLRGPQVFTGYLNNPEATAWTIDPEGYLHTGDIGYYDEEGRIYVTDRVKEVIKSRGYQVVPSYVESELLEHESVADAAVIGIPDEYAGELLKGYVVIKPNRTVTKDQLHQFLSERLAPYKQLKGGIEFVSEIPKSASGKILRRILKEKHMAGTNSHL